MRNGTIKWTQLKSYCRYPYDSFFKLKYIMCTSKPSFCLSIFGLYQENKIYPSKIFFFYEKCRILKTLPCIEKHRNGFKDRIDPNHFQKQKRKSGVSFRSWIQSCKKKVFSPKTLKQCHMTKICSGKSCNRYHTTVVYNVLKSNFEYLDSRWKYSHLIRVLF